MPHRGRDFDHQGRLISRLALDGRIPVSDEAVTVIRGHPKNRHGARPRRRVGGRSPPDRAADHPVANGHGDMRHSRATAVADCQHERRGAVRSHHRRQLGRINRNAHASEPSPDGVPVSRAALTCCRGPRRLPTTMELRQRRRPRCPPRASGQTMDSGRPAAMSQHRRRGSQPAPRRSMQRRSARSATARLTWVRGISGRASGRRGRRNGLLWHRRNEPVRAGVGAVGC